MVCLSTNTETKMVMCDLHLDCVLEHSVVKLAESEAEAAAHLGQADRELPHCRPVQAWIRWAL